MRCMPLDRASGIRVHPVTPVTSGCACRAYLLRTSWAILTVLFVRTVEPIRGSLIPICITDPAGGIAWQLPQILDSRRTACYLMFIHEHLPPQIRRELKQVGWTKAAESTKVARSDGKDFDCAAWMHKARSLPRDSSMNCRVKESSNDKA